MAPPIAPPPQPAYSIVDMATAVNVVVDEVIISDLKDLVEEIVQEVGTRLNGGIFFSVLPHTYYYVHEKLDRIISPVLGA